MQFPIHNYQFAVPTLVLATGLEKLREKQMEATRANSVAFCDRFASRHAIAIRLGLVFDHPPAIHGIHFR